MKLSVLPNTPVPAYKQLYDQISSQILSGELKSGTALPPIRTVSKELGISVITVRSAWDALIGDGYIEARAGSGCYVAPLTDEAISKRRIEALKLPLSDLLSTARSLGFTKEELIKIIEKA